ncbi:MAG: prephenate dehydrogenase/arogenate dehydrogenase family protein [Nitrospirota bacterium]|nr:prephenate dehydrogenase/arogenate dehydrogenase family protein [Nitrospirota bacterium]
MEPHFTKVAIIGVGLIGGSLGLAIRKRGLAGTVVGVGRGEANLKTALERGAIDSYRLDLEEGVKDADLVVLCTPVATFPALAKSLAAIVKPGAIVTDAGSVKESVVSAMEAAIGSRARVVGAHPIAGSEDSGAAAARADLYEGAKCIITPTASTDGDALNQVETLWKAVGSVTVRMGPASHDRIFAAVSHLPHMVAFGLVNTVLDMEDGGFVPYSGGGFRDYTRIAGSHPDMWRDICLLNREQIVASMDSFIEHMKRLREMVAASDGAALAGEFERAREVKKKLA